jgi:quercetin dioxygenase-like cupin family protein
LNDEIRILDGSGGPELPIIDGEGSARAIVWPGIGAETRSLHRIRLGSGSSTVTLSHPSEAVYYVIDGTGSAHDAGSGDSHELRPGAMFHIDAGTPYEVVAGDDGLEVIGGPAPADPAMYTHLSEGA